MLKFKENRSFYAYAYDETLAANAYRIVKNEKESGEAGYYTLPSVSKVLIGQLQTYERENDFLENTETIVVIGIGGSSLGAKAVDSMLKHKKKSRRKLLFFENFDPLTVTQTIGQFNKENSLFICVSKSGGTIETISTFKTILHHFGIGLESEDTKRLMVITDKDSPLSRFAEMYGIKEFNLPLNVVGRFSVLSAVGIVPLYLAGYDVHALLDGAEAYETMFFEGKSKEILEKACFMFRNRDRYTMNVLFVYANALEDFAKWYVQLWAESLGKIDAKGEKVGLTPIGLTGSADQHSFLQLILEGPENKTVTFINIEDFENELSIPEMTLPYIEKTDFINGRSFGELINAQCNATMESIEEMKIPTDKITLPKLSEAHCGELIIYFEILTSLIGAMSEVNTYNQPGVELGKMILKEKFQE
ncbi:MAG: glucose-6-phosphate isomerase [Campylobacterales bacterium]|nr:glucose-6-phosphate isomerase [Campylobacterales bacterium]